MTVSKTQTTIRPGELALKLTRFAQEREWEGFHSPKNLAIALNVEAAELLEHFQWLTEDQSVSLDQDRIDAIAEEIADVQIYLVQLADRLGVDIGRAVERKIDKNAEKYPAHLVRGSAKKYSEYD